MRALLVGLVMIATTGAALACPKPPPGQTCSKYDRMNRKVVVVPPPEVLVHAVRGKLPRTRKQLMKLLTRSVWRTETETLQLLDGSDIPDVVDVVDGARTVIVRGVEKVDGEYQIELDGGIYTLARCRIGKRSTTCLVLEKP
jgi:hypothetical protein